MCGRGPLAGGSEQLEKQSRAEGEHGKGMAARDGHAARGGSDGGCVCARVRGCANACAHALSRVCLFVIPRTVACQATLSMELFKPHKDQWCLQWVLTRVHPPGVTLGSRWMTWWLVFLAYSLEDLLIPGFQKAFFAFHVCCSKYGSSS